MARLTEERSLPERLVLRLRRKARGVAHRARNRGRQRRDPVAMDDAMAAAQHAMNAGDWPATVAGWESVLKRFGAAAPSKVYARLALAHRELGENQRAEEVLARGRDRYPDDAALAIEAAQLATLTEDWPQAVARWEEILNRFPDAVSWKTYARLSSAYRVQGEIGLGAAVLEQGRARFPDDPNLATEWAHLAMVEERWQEAIVRWEDVLARFDQAATWKAYARLAIAHRELGSLDTAAMVLEQGRERFPEDANLAIEWAQLAMVEERWNEAVARWEEVFAAHESEAEWKAYARAAICYRELGDLTASAGIVDRGRRRFPHEVGLTVEWAEMAMVQRDWPEAVIRWQRVLEVRARKVGHMPPRASFPRRGAVSDWFEVAWRDLVADWEAIVGALPFAPDVDLYLAFARTCRRAELYAETYIILHAGIAAHPGDTRLAFELAAFSLDDRRSLPDVPLPGADSRRAELTPMAARNDALLRSFTTPAAPGTDLGSVRVIRYPRGSSLELELRAGRYFSERGIAREVEAVSTRDEWEEMTADENLLMRRARAISDEYGKRFEDLPFLPSEVLSDAVLFMVYHELCMLIPMNRIARAIAAESGTDPVFIETSTLSFRYLDGYTYSRFDVLYLYFALREQGANAFLCLAEDREEELTVGSGEDVAPPPVTTRRTTLTLQPGVRAIRPSGVVRPPEEPAHRKALIPSGVRSVGRVLDALGPALVYSSGSVVKEFAYDRSLRQSFPYRPEASIHPPVSVMPTVRFDMWTAVTLHGVALAVPEKGQETATVAVTSALGGDWLDWLDRGLHRYLSELSYRAHAEVAARGIEEAHICDHLFTEPTIYANAVRQRGGRVVLWPHSANPVHVDQRRPGSFEEVHAVTRAGCERWREAFPEAKVVHSPSLMLRPPHEDSVIDPSQPLSVVIMGGRSELRHLPVLDRTAHGNSYRRLFAGLEALQATSAVDVYFKPRGMTGEHEMWLTKVVGATARWQRVLQHPMRIKLPNVLFVSVSMGTSALLEGLSRGIPGLVVRDFPVRDYTTIDAEVFPTGSTELMLDVIASCTDPGGLRALLDAQLAYYRAEIGIA